MSEHNHTSADVLPDALVESEAAEEESTETGINPADVRIAAMNYLARREHSLEELRLKLRRRFDDEAIIEDQLQRLKEENLQSDERFVNSFVRQRAGRGIGPLRIRREARQKGISAEHLSLAMEEADVDWVSLAQEVLRKKFGEGAAEDIKERARRQRFMQYRGFSQEHLSE
jgi:regulatory protein